VGSGQTRKPASLPVLTMICAYSRWLLALLIPSRRAEDVFARWWQLVEQLGVVPRALVWDGEGAIGRWRAGRAELTAECQAFRGVLAAKVIIWPAADRRPRGIIERSHDYLERSFLPGRTFASPADFNDCSPPGWRSSTPTRGGHWGCAPADRIGADGAAMLALPPCQRLSRSRSCSTGRDVRPTGHGSNVTLTPADVSYPSGRISLHKPDGTGSTA
jgi:hypothetical protein